MKQVIYEKTITINNQVLAINANEKNGCFVEILLALYRELMAMLAHHHKILFLRVDIRIFDYTPNNKIISDYLRKVKRWLSIHYDIKRVGHLWVREIEKAKNQHYHLILLLDGSKIQHPKKLIDYLEHLAYYRDMAKPFTPQQCYLMIFRKDFKNFDRAFYRGSYLAKERGKGYKDKTANDFSASRIRLLKKTLN